MNDKALGILLVAVSAGIGVYYSAWVIGLPFVEPDHIVHWLFPASHLSLLVPAVFGLAFVGSLIIFTLCSLKSSPK